MGFETWRIGDVTITKIAELDRIPGIKHLLPDATPAALAEIGWLRPHFVTDDFKMNVSIHSLVVETPDRRILVDTCVGNDKNLDVEAWAGRDGPFLSDLADAGFPRESIDTVLCTHLHLDHVGWNTVFEQGKWTPTFPSARYLIGEAEHKFWEAEMALGDASTNALMPGQVQVNADSILPIFEAGLADLVAVDHQVCDEVQLVSTPGHTPGHVSVLISSKGEQALITGDFMHHPCQIARPHWCANVDHDRELAVGTRHMIMERFADTPALIIGTHFAAPTAGRLRRDGDTYRLDV